MSDKAIAALVHTPNRENKTISMPASAAAAIEAFSEALKDTSEAIAALRQIKNLVDHALEQLDTEVKDDEQAEI